jgi:hypothetical protein
VPAPIDGTVERDEVYKEIFEQAENLKSILNKNCKI